MKTELKDVLHLYLGCEMQYRSDARGIVTTDLTPYVLEFPDEHYDLKPILRPLSEMTEEDLLDLAYIILDIPGFSNEDKISKEEIFITTGEAPNDPYLVAEISCRCFEGTLEIDENTGDIFLKDDHNKIQKIRFQSKIMKWLLSKGFDLFGLIESDQAIDKTKL